MSSKPRSLIEESLKKKGFEVEQSGRDHRFYYFYYNGKKTGVRTKISTGSGYKDYSDSLLGTIKKQLCFPSRRHLDDFINCPLTLEDYIDILKTQNLLR